MRRIALRTRTATVLAAAGTLASGVPCVSAAPAIDGITLPPGFHIEAYVPDIPHAREMTLGANGTLFVGSMGESSGKVYAVRTAGAGARKVLVLASGLNTPNGVAFYKGALYVAEIDRILRYDDIESHLEVPPKPVEVARLPSERHHGWRYIAFGPDAKLYVPIGAPCNVCERDGFAMITRMNLDGSGRETIARGVRNSVGFTWQPQSNLFWFTDNGRDMLGDDIPSDKLNKLHQSGSHFGFPYCHGGDVPDPEFAKGKGDGCAQYVPPAQKLGPHVAALGVKFYTASQFPEQYRGNMFIAQHGSWNRSVPVGYRIMRVRLDGERVVGYEPFATGWLKTDGQVAGRPVDLLMLADGSMLVSDDFAGSIYRISYALGH